MVKKVDLARFVPQLGMEPRNRGVGDPYIGAPAPYSELLPCSKANQQHAFSHSMLVEGLEYNIVRGWLLYV